MKIREVIEQLQQIARRLPDGLDSQVRVAICNEHEPGVLTPSIQVDTMAIVDKKTSMVKESFAIVQGHPHRDQGRGKTKPITAEIDDLIGQWATDQAAGKSSTPDPIVVKTNDEFYVLLPWPSGDFVKLPFVDGLPLLPGSPPATAAGCLCNPERNNYGKGWRYDDGERFVIRDDCPVHPHETSPTDPGNE